MDVIADSKLLKLEWKEFSLDFVNNFLDFNHLIYCMIRK